MVKYTSRRGAAQPHDIVVNGTTVLTVAPPREKPVVIAETTRVDLHEDGTETVTPGPTVAAMPDGAVDIMELADPPAPTAPAAKTFLPLNPKGNIIDPNLMQPDIDRWGHDLLPIRQSITMPRHITVAISDRRQLEICVPASVLAMPVYAKMDPKNDGRGERPMLAHMVFDLWLGAFVTSNGYAMNVAPATETVITLPSEFSPDQPKLHMPRYLRIPHPTWKAIKTAIPSAAHHLQLLLEGPADDPNIGYELTAWYTDTKHVFAAAPGKWPVPAPTDGYFDPQQILTSSTGGDRYRWLPYRIDPVFLRDATSWLSKVDDCIQILPTSPKQAGMIFATTPFEPWPADLSTGHDDRKEATNYLAVSMVMPKVRNGDDDERYKE